MGKEAELIQASETGNVAKLESLLSQKKGGPLSSLRKGPNVNYQDQSGYTGLHYAALNGHVYAVVTLLQNDASVNIPDNQASYPLHLAAFNGHNNVAKLLINRGPSRANVNEQNGAGDTALHIAAQYGHTAVVQVLLECHADPTVKNSKDETALDLAALYGKLTTVRLLVLSDRSLIHAYNHKHTPLHLAAKNGHASVVEALLDFGMDVNRTCETGTALHETALYGKIDVVKLLVEKGINLKGKNSAGESVLDLLEKHPSQKSQDITALIYEQSQAMMFADQNNRSKSFSYSHTEKNRLEVQQQKAAAAKKTASAAFNESPSPVLPDPKPDRHYSTLGPIGKRTASSVSSRATPHDYTVLSYPRRSRASSQDNFDLATISPPPVSPDEPFDYGTDYLFLKNSTALGDNTTHSLPVSRGAEKRNINAPKRSSEPINTNVSAQHNYVNNPTTVQSNGHIENISSHDNYSVASSDCSERTDTKSIQSDSKSFETRTEDNRSSYDMVRPISSATRGSDSCGYTYDIVPPGGFTSESRPDSIVSQRSSRSSIPSFPPPSPNSAESLIQDFFPQMSRPGNLRTVDEVDNSSEKNEDDRFIIIKDDKYTAHSHQPETSSNIQTRPETSIENESKSEFNKLHTEFSPSSESKQTPVSPDQNMYDNVNISNKPVDNVNISNKPIDIYDNVNLKSNTSFIDFSDDVDINNKPKGNVKEDSRIVNGSLNRFDAVQPVSLSKPTPAPRSTGIKQKRTSLNMHSASEKANTASVTEDPATPGYRLSVSSPEKPWNEAYEWNKIDDFLSSLQEFVDEDSEVIKCLKEGTPVIDSVGKWLSTLGLGQYEASFIANGFDDITFLGGDSLEEQDLREIGIQNSDHIRVMLESASKLPPSPQIGDEGFPIPQTLHDWLEKIKLLDYELKFRRSGYDNMDRIRVMWELELSTVLEIHLVGHRKRMVYSLGRRPEDKSSTERQQQTWAERFAAAEGPRSREHSSADDTMDVAAQLLRTAENMAQGFAKRSNSNVGSTVQQPSEIQKTKPSKEISSASVQLPPKSPTPKGQDQKSAEYKPAFAWKHKPEVLLYESAIYPTQYLGSHPVKEVRGTQSTVDACKKMKATTHMLQKIPTIKLAISVRGIDFIDGQSKHVISSYDIRNISYCAQDPEDLSIFAYITKDTKTGKHYCHVFRAGSLTLADDIILTIGQCFELAYHQHKMLVEHGRDNSNKELRRELQNPLNSDQKSPGISKDEAPPMPIPYAESIRRKQQTKENR